MTLVLTLGNLEEEGSSGMSSPLGAVQKMLMTAGLSVCKEGTELEPNELHLCGTHCLQALLEEDMKGFAFERLETRVKGGEYTFKYRI